MTAFPCYCCTFIVSLYYTFISENSGKPKTFSDKSINEIHDEFKVTRDGMDLSRQLTPSTIRSINLTGSKHSNNSEPKVKESDRLQTFTSSKQNSKDKVEESLQVLTSSNSKCSDKRDQKVKESGGLLNFSNLKQSKTREGKINNSGRNTTSTRSGEHELKVKECKCPVCLSGFSLLRHVQRQFTLTYYVFHILKQGKITNTAMSVFFISLKKPWLFLRKV